MLRHIHIIIALTVTFAASLASAQQSSHASEGAAARRSAEQSRTDSLRAAQDSVLAAANAILAVDSSAIDELEKIALIYKERKRFALQLQTAMRMVAANASSALAHLVHGDALLDNDQPERAAQALQKSLQISPKYVRARVMLAETLEILGHPDSAIAHLDTALRYNPRHANAHMHLGRLLMRKGRGTEAVAHYRAACELLPDVATSYGPWMKLADALMATYAYDDAIEALEYCLRLQPTSADAFFLIAEAHEKAGRTAVAIQAYSDFARRFAGDERALDAERAALRLKYPVRD